MDLKFVILPVYMYYNKITTLYFCNIYQIWDHIKPKDSSTLPLYIEVTTLRCLYQNVYTTGGISGAGMSNPSGASEFTLSFEWNSVT
jgi:hypothetical protein